MVGISDEGVVTAINDGDQMLRQLRPFFLAR